ncbi:MAG: aminopeptidase P family protein [Oscillospiraceae bacterium]|nr:aminopeptidase P family protein [Oscillospiraceae bacterium]
MSNILRLAELLTDDTHGALITSDVSRRYFCGFKSSAGVILVTKECSYLIIDSRYYDKACERVTDCQVILMDDMRKQLLDLMIRHNITRLSVESAYLTLKEYEEYKDKLFYAELDGSSWLSDKISGMRVIKSAEEVKLIVKAQRIAEAAFERLLERMRKGMTEKQVAALLNYYMMDCGADDLSFETIAASGINSASPHAVPTDKPLQEGEFLTLDFGAVCDGYHSDMTRTLVIGEPTPEMEELYNAVFYANLDGLKAVRSDIGGAVVDSVARSTLNGWGGYDKYFGHGLGHGVGLEIHEAPTLSRKSSSMLRAGMIVTVEPGAYISGRYGVRIEDMVLVTDDGCENLTMTTKKLIRI